MRDKQIEEMNCKRCVHYDVCMYVNAKAVEFARAENCKLFKDNAGYRKASDVAREIFEEIGELVNEYLDGRIYTHDFCTYLAELKKKYESEKDNG